MPGAWSFMMVCAATALVAAPASAGPKAVPCHGKEVMLSGQPACLTFLYLADSHEWSVFVRPDSADRQAAAREVMKMGSRHCRGLGLVADPQLRVKNGGWAVPSEMIFTGRCE